MTSKVVTITSGKATAWYHLQDEFYRSLGGYEPLTLVPDRWGGLMTKPRTLYSAIKNGLIKEDIIIFPDNWDVVFASGVDEIVGNYIDHDRPIVISCEENCFPDDLKEDFEKLNPPTKYKYLNSGFIVGKTEAILACLEEMDLPSIPDDHFDGEKNVHPNDQLEWQKAAIRRPDLIELDYLQILNQTLHNADVNDFDFSKKRIRNMVTNTYPCSFHFNGGSKDKMEIREPILKHLNLL